MIGCPCLGQTLSALNWVPLPAWHIDYTVSPPPKCLGNEWSCGWENGVACVAQVLSSDNEACVMRAQMKVTKENSNQNAVKNVSRSIDWEFVFESKSMKKKMQILYRISWLLAINSQIRRLLRFLMHRKMYVLHLGKLVLWKTQV